MAKKSVVKKGNTLGRRGIDRDGWVAASELRQYEKVKTTQGFTTLDSIWVDFKNTEVYNIESWKTHNYIIGENEIEVHNNCLDDRVKVLLQNLGKDLKKHVHFLWKLGYPELFSRGRLLEDLAGDWVYKVSAGWKRTAGIASNFEGLDFFKIASQTANKIKASVAVSMKTTISKDVNQWITSNKDHIKKLIKNKGLNGDGFATNGTIIQYSEIELHIYMPAENLSQRAAWLMNLNQQFGKDIKFVISSIEEHL